MKSEYAKQIPAKESVRERAEASSESTVDGVSRYSLVMRMNSSAQNRKPSVD